MDTPHYNTLLLAVDFEKESEPAIRRAAFIRDLFGARLFLLHVVEYMPAGLDFVPVGYAGDLSATGTVALEEELMAVAKSELDVLGERLGVPETDRLVRSGPTARTIDETAAELGVDLIIVGSHGRHGFLGLLTSTAQTVLRHPTCDVLCVKMQTQDVA